MKGNTKTPRNQAKAFILGQMDRNMMDNGVITG